MNIEETLKIKIQDSLKSEGIALDVNDIIIRSFSPCELTIASKVSYWMFSAQDFDNIYRFNSNCYLDIDVFRFGETLRYFPRFLRKYIKRCECGALYFDQRLMEKDRNSGYLAYLPSIYIGYDDLCNECVFQT